jgi:predicted alpha/beta hydrolase family esterase
MKKVFIIHGFGGIPNAGWIPWLMKELGDKAIYACALPMPNPKKPIVSKWIEEISHAVDGSPDDEIFLVGHSLGATAVLKYLEQNKIKKIKRIVLVSGLISPLDPENLESNYRAIDSFVVPEINFENIKNKAEEFIVLHSTDDPAVPFSHAEKMSHNLSCELVRVEKGGHFFILADPICYKIPELLDIITKNYNL